MPSSFPKTSRLRLSQEFRTLRKEGTQKSGDYLLISLKENAKGSRLGITASKKFGKAHVRNRFKRLMREAFRLCIHQLPQTWDIEVIPKKAAIDASLQDLQKELLHLAHSSELNK